MTRQPELYRFSVSNFTISALPYNDDLFSRYQRLNDMPGFVLLESIAGSQGRYDILSACPYERRVLKPNEGAQAFLNTLRADLPSYQLPLDLPFQGGAMGFFSYDLALELAGIETAAASPLPGCSSLIDIGFYDWGIVTDHLTKTVTLLAVNRHSATKTVIAEILSRWHDAPLSESRLTMQAAFAPLISKKDYQQGFQSIQNALQAGRCYQVNYTQPFVAPFRGESWDVYKQVRAANPVPFAAYLRTDEEAILSFSPERFVQMNHQNLLASPIKGTEKRASNRLDDEALINKLRHSEKNRAENIMIVDMLRNDFSKIAQIGSLRVSRLCDVESFASVHHLVSDIEARSLDHYHPLDIFLACFPGASITGAPKLESMRVIAEEEAYRRGVYCGSIGYFSAHGRFDMNIAIRTLVAREQTLCLSAGGGIVIESDCEEEYRECFSKIESIRKQLDSSL